MTEQQTTCNQAQGTFEQSFCTYASQLTTLCDGQEACRNAAIEHFNKTVTHVHETEIVRKADYRAAKHILCFFGVFDAPDADKNTVLQECKGKTYDTSNLTIIVPGIPDAMPCTPETHQPCDPTWTQAEYGSQTWHSTAPTTDCTPCV